MNNFIIDPMWFYWIQVVDSIKLAFFCITIFSGAIAIGHALIFETFDKVTWKFIIVTIISIIFTIFIPTKQTLVEMEIARHTTYENVDEVIESIVEYSDHIIDRLKED